MTVCTDCPAHRYEYKEVCIGCPKNTQTREAQPQGGINYGVQSHVEDELQGIDVSNPC